MNLLSEKRLSQIELFDNKKLNLLQALLVLFLLAIPSVKVQYLTSKWWPL